MIWKKVKQSLSKFMENMHTIKRKMKSKGGNTKKNKRSATRVNRPKKTHAKITQEYQNIYTNRHS